MIEFIGPILRALQASLELSLASNSLLAVLLVGVAGAAAVAVVLVACRALPVLVAADASGAARRLRQTADPGRLLSQSDPDAPGRARPRAPGRGLAAA
ncbi:DUF6412 domain-containing protein [Agromyces sp. NPDC057679]|uniref:DUF6412 domain-containing protein n=1 Tax=Agromyces sp. NPDC057679 TaxID=3346207 RepID=UPI00366CFED8